MTAHGSLALMGGGEFTDAATATNRLLLELSGAGAVVVVPTAAAFEHPEELLERARTHFDALGATTTACHAVRREDAEDPEIVAIVRDAPLVYLADGSPLHLRSVLKGSALFAALTDAWRGGAVIVASGAGATLVCDPMVDPRGGAYTVGLGWVTDLAVFPYHGTAAEHMKRRSIDLLPPHALLAGVDEATALVRDSERQWRAEGVGDVTLYAAGAEEGRYRNEGIATLAGR